MTASQPTVSVVVTAFNAAPYIEDALDGIAAQGVEDIEVIVADDDSTDATREIAASYPKLDVHIATGPNLGIGGNVARGVSRATGRYIAFIAADDRWRPGHLQDALAALESEPEACLAFCGAGRIDSDGRALTPPPTLRRRRPRSGWATPDEILHSNFIDVWGLVVRADALRDIGGLDPELDLLEWDLLIRIVTWGPVIHIPHTNVDYRVHPGGASRSPEFTFNSRAAVFRKHVRDPVERRRVLGRTAMRAAKQELWPTPTPESLKRARAFLHFAFRAWRGVPRDRLFIPLLVSAHAGRLYIRAVEIFGERFRRSRLKLWLQRIFGMAS